jgi:hypothetical protein
MAMGVVVLEEIAAAEDTEQYPVWIGRCLNFFLACVF